MVRTMQVQLKGIISRLTDEHQPTVNHRYMKIGLHLELLETLINELLSKNRKLIFTLLQSKYLC